MASIGDFADFLMAFALIKTASGVDGGLPKRLYGMMFTNILIDLAVGFVPFVGDLADMLYRANTRNAWLLDAYLTEKARALREGAVQDPDDGSKVRVPAELQVASEDRDVEQGVEPARRIEPAPSNPALAPPSRTLARGDMPPPAKPTMPGRNQSGQRTDGLQGRQAHDPRDRQTRKG
jgi:hypothetical protein